MQMVGKLLGNRVQFGFGGFGVRVSARFRQRMGEYPLAGICLACCGRHSLSLSWTSHPVIVAQLARKLERTVKFNRETGNSCLGTICPVELERDLLHREVEECWFVAAQQTMSGILTCEIDHLSIYSD